MPVVLSIVRALVLLMIMVIIVAVGWNEPLRYRFMSSEDIFRTENPPIPVPIVQTPPPMQPMIQAPPPTPDPGGPKPGSWMWDSGRSGNPLQAPAHR